MCVWVWGAGQPRLTHLALIRPSRASRRFVRINTGILAAAVCVAALANGGWHLAVRQPGLGLGETGPTGRAWWKVTERVAPLPAVRTEDVPVGIWWSMPLAALRGLGALAAAAVLVRLAIWVVGSRAQAALRGAIRASPRLRGAVHYGTAWLGVLALGVLALVLRPVVLFARLGDWTILRSPVWFEGPAVLLGLSGLLLGWFWLIRAGRTVPAESRASVTWFLMLRAPLWILALSAGTAVGSYYLDAWVTRVFDLAWTASS